MADEPMEVLFARLEGKVDTLTQTVELRLGQIAAETTTAHHKAKAAHQRLDEEGQALRDEFRREIRELHEVVQNMQRWQSKMIGVGVGIGAASGVISGLVVLLLSSAGG